jgi:hypothetical protein
MSLDFKIDLTSLVSSIARAMQDSIRFVDVGSIWVNVFIEFIPGTGLLTRWPWNFPDPALF